MAVDAAFPQAIRWACMLGFTCETPEPMRRYTPDGRDAYLFSRGFTHDGTDCALLVEGHVGDRCDRPRRQCDLQEGKWRRLRPTRRPTSRTRTPRTARLQAGVRRPDPPAELAQAGEQRAAVAQSGFDPNTGSARAAGRQRCCRRVRRLDHALRGRCRRSPSALRPTACAAAARPPPGPILNAAGTLLSSFGLGSKYGGGGNMGPPSKPASFQGADPCRESLSCSRSSRQRLPPAWRVESSAPDLSGLVRGINQRTVNLQRDEAQFETRAAGAGAAAQKSPTPPRRASSTCRSRICWLTATKSTGPACWTAQSTRRRRSRSGRSGPRR